MHRNVLTEKKYVDQICVFKDQYLNDYDFAYQKARDKIYCRTLFNRGVLLSRLRELQSAGPNSEVLQYTRDAMQLDNQITQFTALQSFCKKNKKWKLNNIAIDIAEYEALLIAWDIINRPDTSEIEDDEGKEVETNKAENGNNVKPNFAAAVIPSIFIVLKEYFILDKHEELLRLIETWGSVKRPLTFKGNGNMLADAFRRIWEKDFIINCKKKDLELWILQNFQYVNRHKKISMFKRPYLQKCISRKDYPCKHPILRIENNSIVKYT